MPCPSSREPLDLFVREGEVGALLPRVPTRQPIASSFHGDTPCSRFDSFRVSDLCPRDHRRAGLDATVSPRRCSLRTYSWCTARASRSRSAMTEASIDDFVVHRRRQGGRRRLRDALRFVRGPGIRGRKAPCCRSNSVVPASHEDSTTNRSRPALIINAATIMATGSNTFAHNGRQSALTSSAHGGAVPRMSVRPAKHATPGRLESLDELLHHVVEVVGGSAAIR